LVVEGAARAGRRQGGAEFVAANSANSDAGYQAVFDQLRRDISAGALRQRLLAWEIRAWPGQQLVGRRKVAPGA